MPVYGVILERDLFHELHRKFFVVVLLWKWSFVAFNTLHCEFLELMSELLRFSVSLSLTVLHTGKRWFIICPVAETPILDKKETTSHTTQGILLTAATNCLVFTKLCYGIWLLWHQCVSHQINFIHCVLFDAIDTEDAHALVCLCGSSVAVSYIRVLLQWF